MDRPENLIGWSTRCFRSDPGSISGREPIARPGSGTASRDQARPGAPAGTRAPQQPSNPGIWRRWPRAYAEVAVRGDVQRRGGARERRGSVAVRRRWVRIRSITRGWVMKATMRIWCVSPMPGPRQDESRQIFDSPAFRRSKLASQLHKYINTIKDSSLSQLCDGARGRIRTDKGFHPTTCEVAAFTSFATPAPIRRRTLITRRPDA